MTKYLYLGLAVLVVGLIATVPRHAGAQDKNSGSRTVRVKLNYTGSGTVDEKHKIHVALWDTPEFMSGNAGMPIAGGSSASKDGVVEITTTTSPVYASSVYDPSGNWDAQSGPPPSGSSLGVYSKTPGKPEPIEVAPGKTVQVELTFDDSFKMP